ncbi:MAG: protein kinase [Deltaproteobacteria bacterium]|nr:protein kinase [Deltaproteobacteria bacterium]
MTGPAAPCARCGVVLTPGAVVCASCGLDLSAPAVVSMVPADVLPPPLASPSSPFARVTAEADTRRRVTGDDAHDEARASAAETGGEKSEEARFRAGQAILGHYTVVRQLGRGGMGTVYLARDDVSGQEVAVKVLPAALARERDIRERFVQEARALAAMDHPNIVPLITFAQEDDDRFLVMKYIAGESLDARIRRTGVLPAEHARKVLRAVLSALGFAHARGVIHRDVKPSNVIIEGDLEGDARVFLVDWGIAKKESGDQRLTQTGMLMGTPQYMSPEQISGHPIDGRSDLYAAGLILFEMLTGRPPFDAQKTFTVLRMHVEDPVPDVRAARGSELPEDLVAMTQLLLRKDPAERPDDATAAIGMLDGTGSFPVLRATPRETPRTTAVPAPSTGAPAEATAAPPAQPTDPPIVPALASPPVTASAPLDDPSMDEIRAVRPRRTAFWLTTLALTSVVGATVWGVQTNRIAIDFDELLAPVDAGEQAPDKDSATINMLLATARLNLEKGQIDSAHVAVDAALIEEPDHQGAQSLRLDVLLAAGGLEQASEALAALKERLSRADAEPSLVERLAAQEATLSAKKQAVVDAAERERQRRLEREKARDKGTPPSRLSAAQRREIARSTRDEITRCYVEKVQARNQGARGEVTLRLRVLPSGDVGTVEALKTPKALAGREFKACITNQVKRWRFPTWTGDPERFDYVLEFAPSR